MKASGELEESFVNLCILAVQQHRQREKIFERYHYFEDKFNLKQKLEREVGVMRSNFHEFDDADDDMNFIKGLIKKVITTSLSGNLEPVKALKKELHTIGEEQERERLHIKESIQRG